MQKQPKHHSPLNFACKPKNEEIHENISIIEAGVNHV